MPAGASRPADLTAGAGGRDEDPALTSLRHPLTRALLLLTFSTGLIDGASYLGLGHVFSANMTGNIVLLGFGIAGAGGLPVIAPLVSLSAFLVGAGVGGVLIGRIAERRRRHVLTALAIETVLVAVAAVIAALVTARPATVAGDAVIGVLALAMGVRNATVRRLAVPDLTTTVLTMTLTGLAVESPLVGGSGKGSARRIAAVMAMLVGALIGALLLKSSLSLVLIAATVAAAVTLIAFGALTPVDRHQRSTRSA
jgi:uncharacterized membrane protein YoaK (UPF0700 family)